MIWFSLYDGVTPKLREINPHIPTAASVMELMKAYICYWFWLTPFINFPYDILGLPLLTIDASFVNKQSALKNFPQWSKDLITYLFSGKGFVRPVLIHHLKDRGVPCWALGVDNADKLLQAEASGITGLITDDIGWLCDMTCKDKK